MSAAAGSEQAAPFRQFRCMTCGHIYDEAEGDPEHGYPPGTRFEDLPDDWLCPECGMLKEFYEPYEPY